MNAPKQQSDKLEFAQEFGRKAMDIRDLEQGFGAAECGTEAMAQARQEWLEAYYEASVLRLPYTIVRKLVRGVFAEYGAGGDILRAIPERTALELALIGGESYLKPVFDGAWRWRVIPRNGILVFARDDGGEPTDVGLAESRREGRHHYTLLERRQVQNGLLTVTNRLFRSLSANELGREVPLSACAAFAGLPERFTYPKPMGVGLVRLATPMTNCIDGSAEGISVFAPAMELIRALEENERLLESEFRNGASRLVVSRDMLRGGQLKDELFVALDDSPETVGITVFSPELRQKSFIERQQAYLRLVENVIGLKRGLLGEVEAAPRTATEITSSEGEFLTTLLELRAAFEGAAAQAASLVAALGGPAETVELSWGDNVIGN